MDRRDFVRSTALGMTAATAMLHGEARSEETGTSTKPGTNNAECRITGSFFDIIHPNIFDAAYWTDTCWYWKEQNWHALMRDMHAIGIDTAICVGTAFWGRPVFPGYEKTVGIPIRFGCSDPLGACVDEADRLGMCMFFGVGYRGRVSQVRDYARMEPPWPEVWFRWNTALAEALVERFGTRKCFGGLYIAYEIDFNHDDHQLDLYEKLIGEYLRPAVGGVKLLASPGSLGNHQDIARLPKQVARTGINILAPQDYGGRSSNIEKAMEFVHGNARGLEQARAPLNDMGVELWTNCELFDFEPLPDGRGACIGGPIERIRQQIALQAPLVSKLICYQYQGIMNRRTDLVNIGHPSADRLHGQYRAYLAEAFPNALLRKG